MPRNLKVDFHCHTYASKDSLSQPAKLIAAARARGLDRIVVTDHNTIRGALEAYAIDPELVVIGEEVKTTGGELLAAYVSKEVPAGLKPLDAIEQLRLQGAFISVSHPFDYQRLGWDLDSLIEILPYLDAIEVLNARTISKRINSMALEFAAKHQMAGTAGSDAHSLMEIGRVFSNVPEFSNADELRQNIHTASLDGEESPAWVHLLSVYARIARRLGFKPENTNNIVEP